MNTQIEDTQQTSMTRNFYSLEFSMFLLILSLLLVLGFIGLEKWYSLDSSTTNGAVTNGAVPVVSTTTYEPTTIQIQPAPVPVLKKVQQTIFRTAPISWVKQDIEIKRGDNLVVLFRRNNFSMADYYALIKLPYVKKHLTHIRPKEKLQISMNSQHQIQLLKYDLNLLEYLEIKRTADGQWMANILQNVLQKTIKSTHGFIQHSLALSVKKAGLDSRQLHSLIHIFQWKINFARQLHPGDQFKTLYEEYCVNGKPVKKGEIIAVELINRNQTLRAIRYTDRQNQTGYYMPDGQNLQMSFLRIPVQYKRISSKFSYGRMHPILHIVRPHTGVDLEAPQGTPIFAAGDGRVFFQGRKGGYGKTIVLSHTHRYKTVYAHLSRFAKGLHVKSYVKRGQVIGYVGQTGFATGPHLHYEFRIHDVPYNPLTVKLPHAPSISAKERPTFLKYAQSMMKALEKI
jgi:murein DD-endopeptidase MepM/ murein hydrolase activator NlpD